MTKIMAVFTLAALLGGCSAPYENEPLYYPSMIYPKAQERESGQKEMDVRVKDSDKKMSGTVLKLDECIDLAMKNHRTIRMAERRILIADDILKEAWTPNMPTLNAEGKYEARDKKQKADFFGQKITLSEQEAASVRVSAQILLYDFGRTGNQRDSLRAQIEAARYNAEQIRQDITLAVRQTYLRILEAQKLKSVLQESLQLIQEQLKVANDYFSQGMVNKSDVLALDVRLSERKQELISMINQEQILVATLNRLIGLNIERATEIEDILEVDPWNNNFIELLQTSLERRPDLKALRKKIEIAQAEYRSNLGNFAPTFFAFGDFSYSTESSLGAANERLAGGVGFQFPIFDGGATYLKMERKKKEIAEAKDAHDELVDDITLEIKSAFLKVQEAAERIPVAKKTIELANENLRIVRDQYGQGLVTSADVLVEADRLSNTRVGYYRALYDYHQAFSQLLHAIGGTNGTTPNEKNKKK